MITVSTTINATIEKVWTYWTQPSHIVNWYFASDDWHAPFAENNLVIGGKFKTTMAAKDGSFIFDFEGVYTKVDHHKEIEYVLADERKVKITFSFDGTNTELIESFDPETENTLELQKNGWQAILNNFKKYLEISA